MSRRLSWCSGSGARPLADCQQGSARGQRRSNDHLRARGPREADRCLQRGARTASAASRSASTAACFALAADVSVACGDHHTKAFRSPTTESSVRRRSPPWLRSMDSTSMVPDWCRGLPGLACSLGEATGVYADRSCAVGPPGVLRIGGVGLAALLEVAGGIIVVGACGHICCQTLRLRDYALNDWGGRGR